MFKSRKEAGKLLAPRLDTTINKNSLVLCIPRGGIIVGKEIADKLDLQLDVIIAKKLCPPQNSEFAIGAIMHDGTYNLNPDWKKYITPSELEIEIVHKKSEMLRRLEHYRGSSNYNFDNKTVVLVDDGIATGSTVIMVLKWLLKITEDIILAIPVMPAETYESIKKIVRNIVCLKLPINFSSVSQFYEEFEQVTDKEVLDILKKFKK